MRAMRAWEPGASSFPRNSANGRWTRGACSTTQNRATMPEQNRAWRLDALDLRWTCRQEIWARGWVRYGTPAPPPDVQRPELPVPPAPIPSPIVRKHLSFSGIPRKWVQCPSCGFPGTWSTHCALSPPFKNLLAPSHSRALLAAVKWTAVVPVSAPHQAWPSCRLWGSSGSSRQR